MDSFSSSQGLRNKANLRKSAKRIQLRAGLRHEQECKEKSTRREWVEILTAIGTISAAVIAGAAAYIAYTQTQIAIVQGESSRQIANDQWLVAERQANIAENSAERQLRAYITAEIDAGASKLDHNDQTLNLRLNIANSGQTPGYKIRLAYGRDRSGQIDALNDPEYTIGANQRRSIEIRYPFITSAKDPNITGFVQYEDIFGKRRRDYFCYNIVLPGTGFVYKTIEYFSCFNHDPE